MRGGSSATKDVADRERPAGTPSFQLFDKGYSRSSEAQRWPWMVWAITHVMYMMRFRTRLSVFVLSQA